MKQEFNDFDELFGGLFGCQKTPLMPKTATREFRNELKVDYEKVEDGGYIVRAEIPGITEDKLDINVENDIIKIIADYGDSKLRKGKFVWEAEARNIDYEKITANLENGILTLNLPKTEETKPKKINITTS